MIAGDPYGLHVGHTVAEAFIVAVNAEEDPGLRGEVEALIGE